MEMWIPHCCTVVVENAVVMDVSALNSMINNIKRKTVFSGDLVSS